MTSPQSAWSRRIEAVGQGVTLAISTVMKLAGLALGMYAGFRKDPSVPVLAFSGLLIAGVQAVEGFLLRVLDRVLGKREAE